MIAECDKDYLCLSACGEYHLVRAWSKSQKIGNTFGSARRLAAATKSSCYGIEAELPSIEDAVKLDKVLNFSKRASFWLSDPCVGNNMKQHIWDCGEAQPIIKHKNSRILTVLLYRVPVFTTEEITCS